jgi:transcriptional regulator with XRE-family HTH domain
VSDPYRTKEEVGAFIRQLRDERGEKQADLAGTLGLDQSAISKIENGERSVTARELVALSDHFDVSSSTILRREEDAPVLLRAGDAVPDEVREALEDFASCIEDFFGLEAYVR